MADTSSDSSHNNGDCSQFDRLTLEQLALVLTHVPLQQRLTRAALVNTTWAKAAQLSTTSVSSHNCAGLSPWLQAHAARVGVSSIYVWHKAKARPFTGALLLPSAALQHSLQHLCLSEVSWEVTEGPQAAAGLAALTSLTSLSLSGRGVRHLGGLSALSALQKLSVQGGRGDPEYSLPPGMMRLSNILPADMLRGYEHLTEDEEAEAVAAMFPADEGVPGFTAAERALAAALPHLQALTSLHLAEDIASTDVVAAASGLTALQQLVLKDAKGVSFPAPLPQSLTHLNLDLSCLGGRPSLTRATSPGLSRLTGLRVFQLKRACPWDPQLLACSTALTRLVLDSVVFVPQEPPEDQSTPQASTEQQQQQQQPFYGRLQPFTSLTALQHLELRQCRFADTAAGANWFSAQVTMMPAEAGALTVPSQLTELQLVDMGLQAEHYAALFPAGRQLQRLRKLAVTIPLLALDPPGMQQFAACCLSLETLRLSKFVKPQVWTPPSAAAVVISEEAALQLAAEAAAAQAEQAAMPAGVSNLTALAKLQELNLNARKLDYLPEPVWQALGSLTSLTSLECYCPEPAYHEALHLSSLQRLERLRVSWTSTAGLYPDMGSWVFVDSKAPPGFPPDVWRQMPGALYEAVESKMFDMIVNDDMDDLFELINTQQQISKVLLMHERRQADELRAAQLQVRQLQAELEQARQQPGVLQKLPAEQQ